MFLRFNILCLCLLFVPTTFADDISGRDVLEKAFEYRSQLKTGHVEWVLHRKRAEIPSTYFTARWADDRYLMIECGDDSGQTRPMSRTRMPYSHFAYLCDLNGHISYRQGEPSATRHLIPTKDGGWQDLRISGFSPVSSLSSLKWVPQVQLLSYLNNYEVDTLRNGLLLVRVISIIDDRETQIILDPDRGYQPVVCALMRDGYIDLYSLTHYTQYGEYWFPHSVWYCTPPVQGKLVEGLLPLPDKSTRRIYLQKTLYASFNDPLHPQQLTLRDTGIIVGAQVLTVDYDYEPVGEIERWTGSKLVPKSEFVEEHDMDLSAYQHALREPDDLKQLYNTPSVSDAVLSELKRLSSTDSAYWERYTRATVQKYNLYYPDACQFWQAWNEAIHEASKATTADAVSQIFREDLEPALSKAPDVRREVDERNEMFRRNMARSR